ncbi:methyltransferase [Labilibaculum sp. A4]|uniref:Methyltransferase n=1 Tax=Labilibaculum euxinus TaxID=2686357 RepID=A0A425Y978_9BACT|nr:methyltransferase [Labilibaculum euxinus]MDQ1770157.1 methyltransferase [Labilibaculum euxinus]MUP38960.1 methyltransferase [Labilibaculum euxinus]MVB08165.1 methyltransferase [Labilibaculum euxinus]MWN77630.1 methyltransferase [Labilibaculum euxinus]
MLKNELELIISGQKISVNRPEPIVADIDVVPYKRRMDPMDAVDALIEGYSVLIVDYYSSGLAVLSELKKHLEKKYTDQSFKGQRELRKTYRELSHKLLLHITNNKLTVRKAPEIGWLETLYPDFTEFLLPFSQVQGLNSSWQWYNKGIFIPVIDRKIHPFYGTYFPTRFEHLKLFDKWLERYKGEKKSAIDVGIGSGILSFQLLKRGFQKVCGTDNNPNAIIGLTQSLKKSKLNSKIELLFGDLFAQNDSKSDLIVFNPPWLPASNKSEGIDNAIYYEKDLFPRFFAEAKKHTRLNGRVVILFSNLAQITNQKESHPIEKELAEGGRFEKELLLHKKVRSASKNTKRNQNWRHEEMIELWVLKLL